MRSAAACSAVLAAIALTALPAGSAPRELGTPGETLEMAVQAAENAARTSKMKMTVSAVGVDIAPGSAASADLQAAADAGGGAYVAAAQADQLAGALARAAQGKQAPSGSQKRVALLPVAVLRAAKENGLRIEEALKDRLDRSDLARTADAAVAAQLVGADLTLPQPVTRLAEIGKALGVDYVVYTRVLSVGRPFNNQAENERVITVLVNVVEVKTGRILSTNQVGSSFLQQDPAMAAVVPADVAAETAEKLLAALLKSP